MVTVHIYGSFQTELRGYHEDQGGKTEWDHSQEAYQVKIERNGEDYILKVAIVLLFLLSVLPCIFRKPQFMLRSLIFFLGGSFVLTNGSNENSMSKLIALNLKGLTELPKIAIMIIASLITFTPL